jgi:hypothetical protein
MTQMRRKPTSEPQRSGSRTPRITAIANAIPDMYVIDGRNIRKGYASWNLKPAYVNG